MSRAMLVLAIALALSLLANGTLVRAWLASRDELMLVAADRDQAQAAAGACSRGVGELEEAARRRRSAGLRAIERADARALSHQEHAQRIIASPPSDLGDACRSAEAAIDEWLQGRAR